MPSPEFEAFLDYTIEVFQPRYPRPLTREDARQIVENAVGFFTVLLEWHAAAQPRTAAPPDVRSDVPLRAAVVGR